VLGDGRPSALQVDVMGCTPSAPVEDDYSDLSTSEDEDTASTRSPRSAQRDVRHWRRVDAECRALSREPGSQETRAAETPPTSSSTLDDKRVTFRESLEDVVRMPPLSEISRTLRADVYWSGAEFDNLHRQRQRLSVEVARKALAAAKQGTSFTSIEFGGESLRGLGLVDERSLGTIAQRQMRIRDRARRVVAAQLDATRSDQDVADLAERLARLDTATAVTIAARDHLIATGEAPSSPLTPPAPPSASSKNGAKAPNPKSPAHAARRASGVLPADGPRGRPAADGPRGRRVGHAPAADDPRRHAHADPARQLVFTTITRYTTLLD